MSRNFDLTEKLGQYHVMINNIEGAKVLANYQPPKGSVANFGFSIAKKGSISFCKCKILKKNKKKDKKIYQKCKPKLVTLSLEKRKEMVCLSQNRCWVF